MWRKSDVKINFKHFKIYFYCLRVPRRNIWAWICCVAAGNLQNCLTLCRDATSRLCFVASLQENFEIDRFCVATQRLGSILLRRCWEGVLGRECLGESRCWEGVFGRESLLGVCLEEICWDASGLEEGAVNGVAVGRECDSCEWSGC